MNTIHKYKIPRVTDVVQIDMPTGAQVLCVQVQHGDPCIWAIVDTDSEMETRTFEIYGTGHPLPDDMFNYDYLGTFQLFDGAFIGHVFERFYF